MPDLIIDAHVHVGVLGDQWPQWGRLSDDYRSSPAFKIFLAYVRLPETSLTDTIMCDRTLEVLSQTRVDKVVCLALDPIYDAATGTRREELSHMWVDNSYITEKLRPALPDKVLFGASVHPYDNAFQARVADCVAAGAVLIKWLPSAQQFTLADDRVRDAMTFLATAKNGKPLPLLLHVGSEFAIPPHDPKMHAYDFLSWTWQDRLWNWLRFAKAWYTPDVGKIRANLQAALDAGAVIIFAHSGTPVFGGKLLGGLFEHSDFGAVRSYLERTAHGEFPGRCYADLSAFAMPTRAVFFNDIKQLPANLLLFGSDFPVPMVELSAGPQEWWDDFKAAVLEGKLDRLIIPEGNLLDVNYDELHHAFGDHPMFTNFNQLLTG
jgi:predicted TIM-barrel fold metal-dependent hydrolase